MGKAPAFQFYAQDFLTGVTDFTLEEIGAYIKLLAISWEKGPLPLEERRRAILLGVAPAKFRTLWRVLAPKWTQIDTGYVNLKLEQVRADRAAYSEAQSVRGKASAAARNRTSTSVATPVQPEGQPTGQPEGQPESNSSVFDLQSLKLDPHKEREDLAGAALVFPTVGRPQQWPLTHVQIAEWAALYPALDVPAQARQALAWVKANPAKRKTARGMAKFLVAWLTRSVDNAPRPLNGAARVPPPRVDGAVKALCDSARIKAHDVGQFFAGAHIERDAATGAVRLKVADEEVAAYIRRHFLEAIEAAAIAKGAQRVTVEAA